MVEERGFHLCEKFRGASETVKSTAKPGSETLKTSPSKQLDVRIGPSISHWHCLRCAGKKLRQA
jgi:hypothetical protein